MALDAVVHLIDDDDGVRQALAFMLTASGFPVRLYESGLAFLDAIPTLQPGCIVTDVRMPGMDGLELQRQLKSRQVSLPVIVMTGHGDVPLAVQAMKAGAIDTIGTPAVMTRSWQSRPSSPRFRRESRRFWRDCWRDTQTRRSATT
jgi:two-component system response regulator FixJ